jgi:hypothetical protein
MDTALSASSQIFDLKGKTNSLRQKHIRAIILAPMVDDSVGRQQDEDFGTLIARVMDLFASTACYGEIALSLTGSSYRILRPNVLDCELPDEI